MKARDNPFSSRHIGRLAYRGKVPKTEIMRRLRRMGHRGAIVGPKGSGKTMLLETIGRLLQQAGYTVIHLRLTVEDKSISKTTFKPMGRPLSVCHAILLDGAEQMSFFRWRHFRRRVRNAGALVVTSHRAGFLPELMQTRTSPELLADLVSDLLGKSHKIPGHDIERLFEVHDGNIRTALRELYDIWAEYGVNLIPGKANPNSIPDHTGSRNPKVELQAVNHAYISRTHHRH